MNECTCLSCGWVHFGVTREHAETEAREFMDYYESQPKQVQENFGKGQTYEKVLAQYERCFFCGQKDPDWYRPAEPDDCPAGCTIQPVIWSRCE